VVLALTIALALGLLLLAQGYLVRMSHRIFNLPVLVATVALAGVSVWALVGVTGEQSSLASAQRDGSDSVEVLSATNVLLSRAQGDLSLALVNRGTDQADARDFTAVMRTLSSSRLADQLGGGFDTYRAAAARVASLENGGQLEVAIAQATAVAKISDQLSADLSRRIAGAQNRFRTRADDAASALSGLWLAIPLITVLAAALALLGLRQRINEYR
jgi:hypothetical protein